MSIFRIFKNRRKLAQYDRARRVIIARWQMSEAISRQPSATEFDRGLTYAYKRTADLLARELSS